MLVSIKRPIRNVNITFSLHMYAKPSFAHRLQTAKIASSRTSAQNNGPIAQKNGPWVKRVLIERKMW